MSSVKLLAPAKLNFSIDIVGVREDGYHLMSMVMQTVNLCDRVDIETNESNAIRIHCKGLLLDSEKDNIAYKAALEFFYATDISNRGVTITIDKQIPSGAGMGGGSSDGAAVLIGLNILYNTNLSEEQLMQIGEKIGADIPFCIYGGTALVEGIGEKITPIADFPNCYVVVAKPAASVNSKSAFQAYDEGKITAHPDTQGLITLIKWQDILSATTKFCNVFEEVVNLGEMDYIKEQMSLFGGLHPMMTGSGSAVFSIFLEEDAALACYYSLCDQSIKAYICEPVKTGPKIILE
ncbi:MAG: 4-(cytidine 5'-diphospho)-2-C-methyl-D-erythritol kinase [Oscillospiraceae bacterium]